MDLIYWLLLLKVPKVGVRTFYKALAYFEEPRQIFLVNKSDLEKSKIFTATSIDFILNIDKKIVQNCLNWQQKKDCYIITLIDKKYPERLKKIIDPPPILYVRGNINLLNQKQLAVVGSRNPTSGGSDNAREFAKILSKYIVITSGMATGIDSSAHIGALNASNNTIAVCGTGLDRVYPSRNKNLAKQIATSGVLVSELPIGTAPLAGNFPRRNRIITGMSDGVLVVEALIKSGSMVSALSALEQNRDVFAIPGSIKNPLTEAPHKLIQDGATLVTKPEDILFHLKLTDEILKMTKINKNKVTAGDNILLKYLDYDGLSFDELVIKSNLPSSEISAKLLELELGGIISEINNTYTLKI